MYFYIPKTGNIFSLCLKKSYQSISFGRMLFRYSTINGFTFKRPHIHPKMAALKSLHELCTLDQTGKVMCQKCIQYPLEFNTSIRAGNELQYSGYDRTIIDKILRRNNVIKN